MQHSTILIIGYTWPEPATTAAGNRMLQLIQFFLKENAKVIVASTATETEFSLDLEAMGVQKANIKLNHASFDTFIQEVNPEIVLFDRFLTEEQFGWRVAQYVPKSLRVLDTEDLHSLRQTREKAFKANIPFTNALWMQRDITKREVASIYRCDLSLIISSYEMQLLTEVIKVDKNLLLQLSFMFESIDAKQIEGLAPFEDRHDFICMGNGRHAPNVDAVVWLKKEIWPLIREKMPEAKLAIYGAYLPEHIKQMHSEADGFLVKGWAEDAKEVMEQARINLAPLRFGAGIKGKLTDAMLYGTPSITTDIGAEGMHNDQPWNGAIANTAEAFSDAAVALYQNLEAWRQAQQNGCAIINKLYAKESLENTLRLKIMELLKNLTAHRNQNFIGALLTQQTISSTKYMAKWIEEKNRKV